MLRPGFFGESLFDEWMDSVFPEMNDVDKALYGKHAQNMMKTDVREKEGVYQVAIELPGFDKSEISAELQNGYLVVTASKGLDKDEQDKDGRYIRRERYAGAMQRSFYVGENVRQEDIRARYENGILHLEVPRADSRVIEKDNHIAIEG